MIREIKCRSCGRAFVPTMAQIEKGKKEFRGGNVWVRIHLECPYCRKRARGLKMRSRELEALGWS